MKSYFCPRCGKAVRHGECKKQGQHGLLYELLCPDCGLPVRLAGAPIFVLGLVVLLISVMPIAVVGVEGGEGLPVLVALGVLVGLGICFVALMRTRLARQSRTARRQD